MPSRLIFALASVALLVSYADSPTVEAEPMPQEKEDQGSCPPAGTEVPLTKAMNPSFIKDYEDCDIVVEAVFYKMGNEGYMLGKYNTKKNTTFQVLEPGGSPQAILGTNYGTFAGTPKERSDVLFELKQGDVILLRGAPIAIRSFGRLVASVFHAESVTRKDSDATEQ